MSDRNQFGVRRTSAPRQAAIVTPDNILKRSAAQKTSASATLHDTLAHAQDTQTPVSARGESKRPVSFSRRPTNRIERADPALSAAKLRGASVAKNDTMARGSEKTRKSHPLKRIARGIFNFIDRHYKGIGLALGSLAVFGYFHEIGAQNDDKRARLDNEPLATLTPATEHEAAVQAARNLVPSPSKQMKNGWNTAFDRGNMKHGAVSAITGGADIDTLSTKDGTRPDKSYIVSGAMAGKTRAYLGDTLVHGGGNLYKGTYHEKPANPDQARVLEVVDLNELTKRVSDLPEAAYQTSPTEARLDTGKQDKAAREAARKAAAERMAQQKLAQRGK